MAERSDRPAAAAAFYGRAVDAWPDSQAARLALGHVLDRSPSDRARVREALARAEPRGSTALRDAVYAALHLRAPGAHRTAVVVFSDGIDSASWLEPSAVVEAAARSEAIVYGVVARGHGERKEPFLRDVVRATEGRLFEVESERGLRARFLDVLEDIRSRYVLSYTPDVVEGGWHAIEVRLKGVNGDVLARPGSWR